MKVVPRREYRIEDFPVSVKVAEIGSRMIKADRTGAFGIDRRKSFSYNAFLIVICPEEVKSSPLRAVLVGYTQSKRSMPLRTASRM